MPIVQTIAYILFGGGLLWKGGDWLVDGAIRLSQRFGISPGLAGVVILGFGTSFPELAITGLAAYSGDGDIALGNVVGSNIANIALILGVVACFAVVPINRFLLRIEIPIGVMASLIAYAIVLDAEVSRLDGLILLSAFVAYAIYAVQTASRREDTPDEAAPTEGSVGRDAFFCLVGLVAVLGGAWLFLQGAKDIALRVGMSQATIGQTLVAIGTSLPELATALAAARANQLDMAMGNIIGSNIFNLLLVLGFAGVLRTQQVDPIMPQVSIPLMVVLAIFPWIWGWRFGSIGRGAGILLVLTYAGFLAFNVLR